MCKNIKGYHANSKVYTLGRSFQSVILHPISNSIDNHDSGYLGMAVCISSFGTLPYLDPEGIQPKTDGTAEFYALFDLYVQNLNF